MIKSIKPKQVNLSNEEIAKKISLAKKTKVSKEVIDGMIADKINRQKDFQNARIGRLYTGAELKEIRQQIEQKDIKILWRGIPMPLSIAVIEHDAVQNRYVEIVRKEKYLYESLKRDGLSDKQIEEVASGKFKK